MVFNAGRCRVFLRKALSIPVAKKGLALSSFMPADHLLNRISAEIESVRGRQVFEHILTQDQNM